MKLQLSDLKPDTVLTFAEWCDVIGVGGDLDRVLSIPQWAKMVGISESTGRDMIERGDGPPVVQLSPNRLGVRVCDHREWLAERIRPSRHAA
jgi:predicted DNA-binding transcriptional regulator AlpA